MNIKQLYDLGFLPMKNLVNKILLKSSCRYVYSEQSKSYLKGENEYVNNIKPQVNLVNPVFSLRDKFGRNHTYLRVSLTERCSLRCTYCMPEEGVHLTSKPNLLTLEEIMYLTRVFVRQGIRKIRLTGGEPTLRSDIVDIIRELKKIPMLEELGITTNGLLLTKLLVPMKRAGLDKINISLDTLKSSKFEQITRRKGWSRVIGGIDLAAQLGYKPKLNCVVMKDFNCDEICDFVNFTKDRIVDVRFIEYMPFTGNKWQTDKLVSFQQMLQIIKRRWPALLALKNNPNDTSKSYCIPGFAGQIGFITSMTENFCNSCNRLRITADGNLKVCLFGNREVSLRDALRNNCTEREIIALMTDAIKRKKYQHAVYMLNRSWSQQLSRRDMCKASMQPRKISCCVNSFSHMLQQSKWMSLRFYCTAISFANQDKGFTHVTNEGKAQMVDTTSKQRTKRFASAQACVRVGPLIMEKLRDNKIKKGDVATVAKLAGILGAKRTSDLIPLCHDISLSSVVIDLKLIYDLNEVLIVSQVMAYDRTGVEMEALMAVSVAALTIYDMCKALSHDIIISNVMLLEKSGGKKFYKKTST